MEYETQAGMPVPPKPDQKKAKTQGEIDALVYELYGLTYEEIAIVEGKA